MVPKNLEYTAKEIFDPMFVKVSTNPSQAALSGVLQVIVNPYLSQTGGANAAYYVLDLSQPVKPFIFQNRQKMQFVALDNAEAYENFMRKKIYYGVDARFVFGYGDWKLAYCAKG
jgi:phage major head subunit gpT-like protein